MNLRVEVQLQADAHFGLIQKRHRLDKDFLVNLEAAYHRLIVELRSGHPCIWQISSERYPHATQLQDPPLRIHFRWIHDGKVGVIDFEEIEPELFSQGEGASDN